MLVKTWGVVAQDAQGKIIYLAFDAPSEGAAQQIVEQKGLIPLQISPLSEDKEALKEAGQAQAMTKVQPPLELEADAKAAPPKAPVKEPHGGNRKAKAGCEREATRTGQTILSKELLENNDVEGVRNALQAGADVNTRYERGKTPIFLAALNDQREMVRVLLEHGADLQAVTDVGSTVIHQLAGHKNAAMAAYLLEHGANVNALTKAGIPPLFLAIVEGEADMVKVLLEHGADIHWTDKSGQTLLMYAFLCEEEYPEVVRLLCEGGVDVNAQTPDGFTALKFGAYHGYLEAIKPLLDYGVDVSAESKDGVTAYEVAKTRGHKDVARLLFRHGARIQFPPGCMAVTTTPFVQSGAAPILSLSKKRYHRDTEACVCDNPDGELAQEYHGTGLPLREHPDGETIIRSFGEERIVCNACGSAHVLVITLKWSIHPMQGDFYCDCEVVCQDCHSFTAFSADTY